MFATLKPLTATLVASLLLLVPTVAPWMHRGCEHDHSTPHAAAHPHSESGCNHGHHRSDDGEEVQRPVGPVIDSQHSHAAALHDCAACRYLLLTSLPGGIAEIPHSEAVSLLPARAGTADPAAMRVSLYFSRGPPALG